VSVAIGGFDFENAVPDFQHRNIECAAAEVVHRDFLILLFVQAVSQ